MFIHITSRVFAKEIKYSVSIICDTHMAIVWVGDLTNKQSMKYFELKYIWYGLYMYLHPASCTAFVIVCGQTTSPSTPVTNKMKIAYTMKCAIKKEHLTCKPKALSHELVCIVVLYYLQIKRYSVVYMFVCACVCATPRSHCHYRGEECEHIGRMTEPCSVGHTQKGNVQTHNAECPT